MKDKPSKGKSIEQLTEKLKNSDNPAIVHGALGLLWKLDEDEKTNFRC